MSEKQKLVVWITKYALTAGIKQIEVQLCDGGDDVMTIGRYSMFFHGEGNEWHRKLEDARSKAELMRKKRIESLEKQLEKLKKLTIKEVEMEKNDG